MAAGDHPDHSGKSSESEKHKPVDLAGERHYSIQEIADLWKLSEKTVRGLFAEEPGVIELGSSGRRFRRGYVTRRIPESVAQRVHRRLRRSA